MQKSKKGHNSAMTSRAYSDIFNFNILSLAIFDLMQSVTDAHTYGQMDWRTGQNQYAPSTSSKLGA